MAIELEDGTVVLSLPEQVEENKAKVEEVDIKVDNLAARVAAALAGVLHYKGSVATYSDLPADAEIGDVYNVIDTGANYAWTGSEWDELGSVVDLSNCVTLDGAQTIIGLKEFEERINIGGSDNTVVSLIAQTNSGLNIGMGGDSLAIRKTGIYQIVSGNFDLGTSARKFYDLYLSNALNLGTSGILKYDSDISSFTSNSHFSPAVTESYDLGSSAYSWRNIYIQKLFDKWGDERIALNGANTTFNTSLQPNGTRNIGSDSAKWNDFYISGIINPEEQSVTKFGYFGDADILRIETNFSNDYGTVFRTYRGINKITFRTGVVLPFGNNVIDFGNSSRKWKDVYLAGNLSDGTNSVTVADLAALIAYAKAQGWIS